jgi:hypothetical protein
VIRFAEALLDPECSKEDQGLGYTVLGFEEHAFGREMENPQQTEKYHLA